MTASASVSTKELDRIASLAYTGKVVEGFLAYDPGDTLTVESTVAAWDALELTVGTNGYARSQNILGTPVSDTVGVEVSYPYADFSYTASGGNLTFDTLCVRVGELGSTVNISTTERATNIATVTAVGHGLIATDQVYITGTTSGTFDGFWEVLSAPTADTFTFNYVGADITQAADTGTTQLVTYQTYLYGYVQENPDILITDGATQTYRIYFTVDN